MARLYGAIEAGGTKFVCAVGNDPENMQEVRFPTTTPQETLGKAIAFFSSYKDELCAIGIGSFGPVDLNRRSEKYGYITSTPKPGWADTDVVGTIAHSFPLPIGFDTDVNAAALGEQQWGAAKGLSDFIYITIGTGIGGGVMSGGQLVHGLVHPELGHTFLPKHKDDHYAGKCPYHQDLCFEGLAAGPAIEERWGKPGAELDASHKAWDLQAYYVSLALANFICTYSPQRIILGGGVMEQAHLLEKIHEQTASLLNGYVQHTAILSEIHEYIVRPGLNNQSGIAGAMMLARHAMPE